MTFTSTRAATDHFTQIANEALRDPRLSYRAKGILAAALTHEAGFSFGRSWIDSHGTEGRDAITTAIAELKALGYCRAVRTKNQAGDWQGTTLVFTDAGTTENPSLRHGTTENAATENAATENAATENPSLYKTTNSRTPIEEHHLEGATLQAAQPNDGAQPVQGILLTPDTPVANTGSQAKRNASPWPVPPEFAQFSELLDAWLELRLVVNPHSKRIDPWGKRQRSAGALRLAIAKGVAVPFLEEAAERGWVSLGHNDHKQRIERLAAPVTALPRTRFSSNPNPHHPTLQPYVRTAC